ncbi:MAG: hypothetical protein ACLQGN_26535 [Mycobacterium sp.]|uniref:hypothetical protein n=1 Tax=Mycobacterium sp. TaxID=1785 RepID=UPI003F967F09
MTIEQTVYVRIPQAAAGYIAGLDARARAALSRSAKLPPGDRSEAIRFEALHAAIDQLAIAAIANGEPHLAAAPTDRGSDWADDVAGLTGTSVLQAGAGRRRDLPEAVVRWLQEGMSVVELRLPHAHGVTIATGEPGRGPPRSASRWRSTGEMPGQEVRERFEYLISSALADSGGDEAAILPSGVSNTVLTEALRRHAHAEPDARRIDLPVRYRDGSHGPWFPLRALAMTDQTPENWRQLRFTLMSIRHVDMDAIVHGAWLRNSRVSQRRPVGLTDQIVFETSRQQLRRLDPRVPTVIHIYQTGLEPAIVGFYRAVVWHLIEHPKSIAVIPYYFQGGTRFVTGTTWATA